MLDIGGLELLYFGCKRHSKVSYRMANTCLNVRDMISGKRNWKEHWRPEMFYFHPVAQYGSNTRFARGAKAFHVAEDWPHIRDIYNLARGEEAQMRRHVSL